MDDDLTRLSALELAAAIGRGDLSAGEAVEYFLDRIDRLGAATNSVVTLDRDGALAAARGAQELVGDESAPVFNGVPLAVKDTHLTRGLRTTFGTRGLAGYVPDFDDEQVARLRAAGFVVVGKTNVPELGTVPFTESELLGPCRNPWDPARTPGGSSGGSAAALAAGLVPAVTASDGGGSIRIPAANCGLFGMKPARGRVSSGPLAGDLVAGLGVAGPLTRDVADAAAMLDATRGYAVGDPHWAPDPPEPYLASARRDPPPLRVGLVTESELGTFSADMVRVVEEAAKLLESLGHLVEPTTLPVGEPFRWEFEILWAASVAATPVDHSLLEPFNAGLARRGAEYSAARVLQAQAALALQSRVVVGATAPFDVVMSPTLMRGPLAVGELSTDEHDPDVLFERLVAYVGFTPVANVTGQPSMTLPLGCDDDGLPAGVLVTGRPADETTLFSLAGQIQRAVDWTTQRPPPA